MTTYIESSRFADNRGGDDNSSWTTSITSGINLYKGDEVTLQSSAISIRGDTDQSVEFQGQNLKGFYDNKITAKIAYYVNNNHQFAIPLPLNKSTYYYDPQRSFHGQPDLSTYANFKQSTAIRGIECVYDIGPDNEGRPIVSEVIGGGPSTACRKALYNPSKDRFYLQDRTTHMTPPSVLGLSNDYEPFTFLEKEIDFEVPEGFNSISNIQNTLTEAFHKRIGNAEDFDNDNVTANYDYFFEGTYNSGATFERNTLPSLCDASYIQYPTMSGDLMNGRIEGTWSGQLEGENAGFEGSGYTYTQGEIFYFKNLASATPYNMMAAQHFLSNTYNNVYEGSFTVNDANFSSRGFYTGWSNLNSGVCQFGNSGTCIIDDLDSQTISADLKFSESKTIVTTKTSIDCIKTSQPYTVVVTNMLYNDTTMANIAKINKNRLGYGDILELKIGRADDEASFSSNVVNLPCPNVHLNGTSKNSYVDNILRGKKSYAKALELPDSSKYDDVGYTDVLKCLANYDSSVMEKFSQVSFPSSTLFKSTDSKGRFYNQSLSRTHNLGIVPVFYKAQNTDASILDVPFCAFIIKDAMTPEVLLSYTPIPEKGEYFCFSGQHFDNKNAFIVSTQKKLIGDQYDKTYPEGSVDYNCSTYLYRSFIYAGADNPEISFDSTLNRFSISNLHKNMTPGSGSYQLNLSTTNDQATVSSIGLNFNNSMITRADNNQSVLTFIDTVSRDVISSQSGIGILDWQIEQTRTGDPYNLTADNFDKCLLQKLGFTFDNVNSALGKPNNEYSSPNIKSANTDELKYRNYVYPLTTNGQINASALQAFILNAEGQQMSDLGCIPEYKQVLTNQDSAEIIADNLPVKLSYPNYVILSDIIPNLSYYGSKNGKQRLSALGYANLSFSTGGYIYGNEPFSYIVEKDSVVSEINILIRRPDGTSPILDNKSVVVIRINRTTSS
eukprot:GHVU01171663.1.p1 GENE.GHVU01171663.1~~GHVU01171663.1.p1  ORF type:complete len:950 (+),score=35.63 GHVU01171663.1:96-2945(+)